MLDLISSLLLWIGGFITLIGAIGMLRFPDFYTRAHAATVVTIGGFSLSLMGILIVTPLSIYFTKTLLIFAMNLLTNPTGTHALADSAYRLGIMPKQLAKNDLKGGRS